MKNVVLFLMLGTLTATLLGSVLSVYVLHDVDRDMVGHLNQAFAGLCVESLIFTLVIGAGVALLTSFGSRILHLNGFRPRLRLGALLGVGITVLQYPWDFATRYVVPRLAQVSLYLYLLLAILVSAAVILRAAARLQLSDPRGVLENR